MGQGQQQVEAGIRSHTARHRCAPRCRPRVCTGTRMVDGGDVGPAMTEVASDLDRLALVATPEAAAEPLGQWLQAGDVVLLKASRGVALERLIPLLHAV